jgi:hypothetical protein
VPRVKTATRRRAVVKRPMNCRLCGNEIGVGQSYYTWQKRYGGPQFTHVTCGRPTPTMLSDRKTAVIEEAIMGIDFSSWNPTVPADWDGNTENIDVDYSDVQALLQEIADSARDVGSEYESGADNMPENLMYSPTAEAMREVAQELETWADDLESFEPNARRRPTVRSPTRTSAGESRRRSPRGRTMSATRLRTSSATCPSTRARR